MSPDDMTTVDREAAAAAPPAAPQASPAGRDSVTPHAADAAVAPPDMARAPVVAADLEGTCTAGATWRGVGRWLAANGRRGRFRRFLAPRLAAIPLVRLGLVSREDFRNRWIRDLARLLEGLTPAELEAVAGWVVDEELWPARRRAVIAELEAAAAAGSRVVLASGTYQPVLDAFVGRMAGGAAGDVVGLGTPLEVREGRVTGRLAAPIGTGPRKAARVRAVAGEAPLAVAYGDSLADVPLLEQAAEAVAVAPDGDLGPLAVGRGWRILDDPAGDPRPGSRDR
jgi:phosphoserine phosphatase